MTIQEYEAKRLQRIERFEALARKAQQQSDTTQDHAHKMASIIPFGQPILIGHHSEKRDRNYRARIERTFRKAQELRGKAAHYARRVEAANSNGAISSDDPGAVAKLTERLLELEKLQAGMVAANKIIRRPISDADKIAAIVALGFDESRVLTLLHPRYGPAGFPGYSLQNHSANMRRIRQRITELQGAATRTNREFDRGPFKARQNVDINRVQLIFPGKPAEDVRTILKRHGFRWSPSEGAWQRQLNNSGVHACNEVQRQLLAITA